MLSSTRSVGLRGLARSSPTLCGGPAAIRCCPALGHAGGCSQAQGVTSGAGSFPTHPQHPPSSSGLRVLIQERTVSCHPAVSYLLRSQRPFSQEHSVPYEHIYDSDLDSSRSARAAGCRATDAQIRELQTPACEHSSATRTDWQRYYRTKTLKEPLQGCRRHHGTAGSVLRRARWECSVRNHDQPEDRAVPDHQHPFNAPAHNLHRRKFDPLPIRGDVLHNLLLMCD
ncbi:hypothetical protein BC834DRAFT_35851 [Gloeopeniophorella convolvens]|nr:hypothetical protein BC834DRAFT_35851 [Gloeopeniophorella convolvens]